MIQSISARMFRGIQIAQIDPAEGVTLLLGGNGAGKSSVQAAVEMALTGSCRWTDAAGKGASVLVSHLHPQGAEVELRTANTSILRQITPKGSSVEVTHGGQTREGKDATTLLQSMLPSTDLLRCLLRTEVFVSLPPKDQQDILFALAGGEVNVEWFRKRLTETENELLEEAMATRVTGSALADRLYQNAYGMRAGANKAAKASQAALDGYTFPQPALDGESAADVGELEARLAELNRQIGGAEQAARESAAARDAQGRAAEDVKRFEAALKALPEAVEVTDEQIAAAEAAETAAAEASAGAREAVNEETATVRALQQQLDKFSQLSDTCVLGDIPCPMTAEARSKLIKSTQADLDGHEVTIAAGSKAVDAADAALAAARNGLRKLQEAQRTAASIGRDRERLTADLARAKETMKATLKAAKPAAGAGDLDKLTAQRDDLQEQISGAREAQAAATRREQAVQDHARLQREARETAEHAATLDALVKKLEPAGLPAQAMAETLGTVLDEIDSALAQFTNFRLQAEPGKDFGLEVVWGDSELTTPVRCLSGGERLMVGAAIQVALARLVGWQFVMVDEADTLDATHLPGLLMMLLGSGVQALVASSRAMPEAAREAMAENGVRIYDMADGTAECWESESVGEVAS